MTTINTLEVFHQLQRVSDLIVWRCIAVGKLIADAGTTGIIAVGASKPTVTADANGRIGVERQMTVNLTCDHRIVYGTDAAEFMKTLKAVIESPDQLTF